MNTLECSYSAAALCSTRLKNVKTNHCFLVSNASASSALFNLPLWPSRPRSGVTLSSMRHTNADRNNTVGSDSARLACRTLADCLPLLPSAHGDAVLLCERSRLKGRGGKGLGLKQHRSSIGILYLRQIKLSFIGTPIFIL